MQTKTFYIVKMSSQPCILKFNKTPYKTPRRIFVNIYYTIVTLALNCKETIRFIYLFEEKNKIGRIGLLNNKTAITTVIKAS